MPLASTAYVDIGNLILRPRGLNYSNSNSALEPSALQNSGGVPQASLHGHVPKRSGSESKTSVIIDVGIRGSNGRMGLGRTAGAVAYSGGARWAQQTTKTIPGARRILEGDGAHMHGAGLKDPNTLDERWRHVKIAPHSKMIGFVCPLDLLSIEPQPDL